MHGPEISRSSGIPLGSAQSEPAGPQEHPLAKLLRQYLPNAILAQAAGIEPSQVATLVLANVASSDKLRADLLAMLDTDDALAALAAIDPGVNKNPQWFNEFGMIFAKQLDVGTVALAQMLFDITIQERCKQCVFAHIEPSVANVNSVMARANNIRQASALRPIRSPISG